MQVEYPGINAVWYLCNHRKLLMFNCVKNNLTIGMYSDDYELI